MTPEEEPLTDSPQGRSRLGLVVTGVLGGSLLALYAVAAPFVTPALRKVCLPFVPATSAQVEHVLRALQGRAGSLVDIGSGDGRIVSSITCKHVVISQLWMMSLWFREV